MKKFVVIIILIATAQHLSAQYTDIINSKTPGDVLTTEGQKIENEISEIESEAIQDSEQRSAIADLLPGPYRLPRRLRRVILWAGLRLLAEVRLLLKDVQLPGTQRREDYWQHRSDHGHRRSPLLRPSPERRVPA